MSAPHQRRILREFSVYGNEAWCEHSVRNSGISQGSGVWGALKRHPVPTEGHPAVCEVAVPLGGAIRLSCGPIKPRASYAAGRARQSWSVCQNSLSPCGRVPWDLAVCGVGGWVLSNPGFHRDSPPPLSFLWLSRGRVSQGRPPAVLAVAWVSPSYHQSWQKARKKL